MAELMDIFWTCQFTKNYVVSVSQYAFNVFTPSEHYKDNEFPQLSNFYSPFHISHVSYKKGTANTCIIGCPHVVKNNFCHNDKRSQYKSHCGS